ncbi:hypothetical protein MMC16_006074 [Acarospora aff. strigata]|nr:hypothetical protein [Acarospora aff. strigata]
MSGTRPGLFARLQASDTLEAPRSTTVADASFDPFLPRPSSRVNPRSSSGVSSRHRVHRSYCGPQATGFSAKEQIRPSRATASTKHTKSPAHSLPDFAQYVTGAGPSSFQSEIVSDARARGNNDSAFDVMADKKSSLGSAADVDGQGHSTFGQELPVPSGFEWDLSSDSDFDALCVALTPSAFLTCMPKDPSDAALQQDTPALAQDTDGFSAGTGDNTSKRMDSCSDNTRTCMISALNILQALHIPPSACLCACDEPSTPSPRQPRMLDSVLSTNRDVVRLVSNMLKCTCSLSSQVQLVLTIICGKLMAWYRAMIRDDHGGCDDNNNNNHLSPIVRSSVVNNNNMINDEDHTERVLHQPITVGDYSFDGALESKIRAQVVSSELQHLEALVEKLSGRIQDAKFGNLYTAAATRSGSAATAENETGLAEAIHRSLIAFLRKQLQAAKAATTPMPSPGEENGRAGLRATV